MADPTVSTVSFSKLKQSDLINARAASKEGIAELAASIAAKGLIQPLAVRVSDSGAFEVIDGRRRYAALARLVKEKTIAKDHQVPVLVRVESDSDALETSLMANTVRLPMHPVDQFVVFARLAEQGKTDADIAASFGITEKTVRQHKALGALAPEVRAAWRKGTIDADVAKAFTAHPDHAVQVAAFTRLKKEHRLSTYGVRQELSGERLPVSDRKVEFVGLDTYIAAGGTVAESLFDDENFVEDAALLKKLVADKMQAERQALLDAGWAWAEWVDNLPNRWPNSWHQWKHVKGDNWDDGDHYSADDYSREERAKSGVAIDFGYEDDGSLDLRAGLIRPEGDVVDEDEDDEDDGEDFDPVGDDEDIDDDEDAPADKAEAEAEEANPFAISQALQQTVTESLTVAAAKALASDPNLAMRIITAALTSTYMSPANIRNEGHHLVRKTGMDSFTPTFNALLESTDEFVAARFCEAVGTTLDLTHKAWVYKGRDPGVGALRDALRGDVFLAAAREEFNAADFFKRSSKAVALAAALEIHEAKASEGLAPTKELAALKKGELADAITTAATECGWLPPDLRHPEYALGEGA